jgi:putative ABC transport system ATP-binding protein
MKIELSNISLSFNEQKLFSNFSLKVESGEKVWLKAPSGGGKSTLMKIIFGFQQPGQGEVFIDGEKMDKNNINEIRSKMGYVAQNIPLPKMKVENFIEDLIQFENNSHLNLTKAIILNEFEKYDLAQDILKKNTEELSGGERQRFGFALLKVLNRELWLLDEITSGLDQPNARRIIEEVEKTDATVIIISHDEIWEILNLKKVQINE